MSESSYIYLRLQWIQYSYILYWLKSLATLCKSLLKLKPKNFKLYITGRFCWESVSLPVCERDPPMASGFTSQRASYEKNISMSWLSWCKHDCSDVTVQSYMILHQVQRWRKQVIDIFRLMVLFLTLDILIINTNTSINLIAIREAKI